MGSITVENLIEHIEDGLYDGIFFHRVINDLAANLAIQNVNKRRLFWFTPMQAEGPEKPSLWIQ